MRILGVRVDCVDMAGAVDAIGRLVDGGGPTRLVATVNPEFVMRARVDHSPSSRTAFMKPSETRTEWLAFWKKIEV